MVGQIASSVLAGLQVRQARENQARIRELQQRQIDLQEFATLAGIVETANPALRKVLVQDFMTQFGGDTKSERTKNLITAIGAADEQQLSTLGDLIRQAGVQGMTPKQLAASGVTAKDLFSLITTKQQRDRAEERLRTRPTTTLRSIPQPSGAVQETAVTTTPAAGVVGLQRIGEPGFRVQAQPTTVPRTRADELQGNLDIVNTNISAIDDLIQAVETNPTAFGVVGSVRGLGQATVDILRDVVGALTPGFAQNLLNQAREGVEQGLIDQETADEFFDPQLPESETIANALAYGLALRRKNFRRINREDLAIAREEFRLRGVRGTRGILTKLRTLRREFASGQSGLERRLGVQQRRDNGGLSQEEQDELERLRREQGGG